MTSPGTGRDIGKVTSSRRLCASISCFTPAKTSPQNQPLDQMLSPAASVAFIWSKRGTRLPEQAGVLAEPSNLAETSQVTLTHSGFLYLILRLFPRHPQKAFNKKQLYYYSIKQSVHIIFLKCSVPSLKNSWDWQIIKDWILLSRWAWYNRTKSSIFILWEKKIIKSQNMEILFYRKFWDFEIWVELHLGQSSETVNFLHITEYSQE